MANLIILAGIEEHGHYAIRSGGQYQLASWLRSFDYTVKVIDFCFKIPPQEIEKIIRKHIDENTLAIGVSSTFWEISKIELNGQFVGGITYPSWLSYLRLVLKKEYQNIKWILGGANSLSPVLEDDWVRINYFAEDETLSFLDKLTGKDIQRPKFDIQNFVKYYSKDDHIQPYETLSIEISRGCIFKCKFCQFPLIGRKKGTNIRNENDIRTELMENYKQFGITKYYFADDTFNESIEKVKMIHRISKSLPFELEYVAYVRLDLIATYPEMITLLPESGLRSAFFGIESFQSEGAKSIGKGWNGKFAKEFLLRLKEEWKGKTNWWLSMIVGLPGWNREQEENDLQWLIDNDMEYWYYFALYINPINVINGQKWVSEFEINYKDYGYQFTEDNFVNWTNGNLSHAELKDIAEELNNRSFEYKKIGGFEVAEASTALRCKMKDLLNVYNSNIDQEKLAKNSKDFIEQYIRKSLE